MSRSTVRELIPAVGQTIWVRMESLQIRCTVIDAKNSWGKVRLLVMPVAGQGTQWIELERLVAVAGESDTVRQVCRNDMLGGDGQ